MIRYTRSVTTSPSIETASPIVPTHAGSTSMAQLIQATTAPTPPPSKPRLLVAYTDEWLSIVRNQYNDNLSKELPVINNTTDLSKGLSVINNTTDLSKALPVTNDTTDLSKGPPVINDTTDLSGGSPVINNTSTITT